MYFTWRIILFHIRCAICSSIDSSTVRKANQMKHRYLQLSMFEGFFFDIWNSKNFTYFLFELFHGVLPYKKYKALIQRFIFSLFCTFENECEVNFFCLYRTYRTRLHQHCKYPSGMQTYNFLNGNMNQSLIDYAHALHMAVNGIYRLTKHKHFNKLLINSSKRQKKNIVT